MSLRNYEIRQKLGSGSYGVIYKAYNKIDKSVCVLKQISLTRMSEKARKNAVNEAHIMGKLKHPFIVCYYESFIEDNNLNILMEFCEGGDLCYLLKQQNKKYLKEQKIWKFFIQICMGLEHIHKNKILHRDIKTLNIFLHKNEMVKIGDLGVAKMLNSNDFAHTMVGTPFYLSPELCEQKPYNEKSDIWALGCLLYELCTFRHPFEAANQASLILKIIRGKYEPIPEFYSKELRQMINLCLQRDYKRRPTANMILSKPYIKKMMEEFELNKIVDQFYNKAIIPSPQHPPQQILKPQAKVIENKPLINKAQIKPPIEKPKKVLDDAQVIKQPVKIQEQKIQPKPQIKQQKKQKKPEINQHENVMNKRRESQPALKQQKDQKPKILFGSENKADFISALQSKIKSPPKKMAQPEKSQVSKKSPISFQVPWKIEPIKKNPQESNNNEDQNKVIVHNKNILFSEPSYPIQKNSEVIQKVKVEKKVEPKVYDMIKQSEKPHAIIKSAGFSQGRPQTGFDRKKDIDLKNEKKSVQIPYKPVQQQPKQPEKQVANSMKNIRKSSEQRPTYIIQKQPENENQLPHYPPKFKKPSFNQQQKPKIPKHLPHQHKPTSASRFTEVTKQEEDLVANLPDKVKKKALEESYIEEPSNQKNAQRNQKIQFKQIDDQVVLKMYEQMMKSSQKTQQSSQRGPLKETEENQQNIEQIIQQNPSFFPEDQNLEIQQEEERNNNSQMYYQVNKYEAEDMVQSSKTAENQLSHQWSFDEEPELPMLEQTQTPLFEQANPYLVEEMEDTETKKQEEILEDKKSHLQIKLKENMKREDQINRLMQMKIQECKAVVPKNFEEILVFFRSKINMDREYTEEDERQVESFLAKRNLTDQRKFQNIYKIMHFEMQLQNTRKIIQSICKKLNELQKQKNNYS